MRASASETKQGTVISLPLLTIYGKELISSERLRDSSKRSMAKWSRFGKTISIRHLKRGSGQNTAWSSSLNLKAVVNPAKLEIANHVIWKWSMFNMPFSLYTRGSKSINFFPDWGPNENRERGDVSLPLAVAYWKFPLACCEFCIRLLDVHFNVWSFYPILSVVKSEVDVMKNSNAQNPPSSHINSHRPPQGISESLVFYNS